MSSTDENSILGEDEASSNTSSGVSSETAQGSTKPVPLSEDSDIMKRAAAKKLIERYFYQLLDGCGNADCDNQHCASNSKAKVLTPNQAAAQAIHLFSQEARLCDAQPSKVARTSDSLSDRLAMSDDSSASQSKESDGSGGSQSTTEAGHSGTVKSEKRGPLQSDEKHVPYITEEKLLKILETCKKESSYSLLIRTLGMVFSSADCLSRSFVSRMPDSLLEAILDKAPSGDLRLLKKEDVRALEGDLDKDEDSQEMLTTATLDHLPPLGPSDTHVDLPSLRRAYAALFNVLLVLQKESLRLQRRLQPNFRNSSLAVFCAALARFSAKLTTEMKGVHEDQAITISDNRIFCPVNVIKNDGVESDVPNLERVLVQALSSLMSGIEISYRFGYTQRISDEDMLHILIIVFELPVLGCSEYLEVALPKVCQAAAFLPVSAQARLARIWAKHSRDRLKELLVSLQQLVTLKVISGSFSREHCVQEDDAIAAATKLMKVVYFASIIAGEMDSPDLREDDPSAMGEVPNMNDLELLRGAITGNKTTKPPQYSDPLGLELQVKVLDSRTPYVPFSDFYNEPLSDAVEMDQDFAIFKSDSSDSSSAAGRSSGKFSFMRYAFILTPATKTLGLYYDNRVRMYNERRLSIFETVLGQPTNPYLRLKVRRDHIIHDALVELEMVAMENPKDLKKQLVVEFEGEQGVDEGGVSKEFFQLIVEEIFKPDYGMFTYNQETETVWFNPTSFESDAQFKLIGILLGLAIYNNIILDIHFPMVVYRKLMGKRATFYDLEDWNKTLFHGLQSLLDYQEDDMEEAFMQTFRICYQDVFGTLLFHDLKENADTLYVNKGNRHEFVDLYADFLLNTSVEKQFRAFRLGFQMVTDESPLHLLFRPEEVEQLVCGSKNFDFNELEDATKYDGGYTSESPVVRFFWQIVHHMPLESKRKLLQFATGSDRVPVGGFSKLKLIIARNGPDSDRLPTAHTCYNVLLLPEYSSKEKLMDRLEKAINNSKGFGML